MCACDRSYVCPRCAAHEAVEPDDREREEEARYKAAGGAERPQEATEA